VVLGLGTLDFGLWQLFSYVFAPWHGMIDRVEIGGRPKSGGESGFGTWDFRLWTLVIIFIRFCAVAWHD
jgi:hypothetical protein